MTDSRAKHYLDVVAGIVEEAANGKEVPDLLDALTHGLAALGSQIDDESYREMYVTDVTSAIVRRIALIRSRQ